MEYNKLLTVFINWSIIIIIIIIAEVFTEVRLTVHWRYPIVIYLFVKRNCVRHFMLFEHGR